MGLQPGDAVDDVDARLLQRFAQWMLASSSKRAFSSTMQTACLPRSEARISDGTSGESSLVRYTVCLIASTSGSSTACSTKRSTEVAKES